MKTRKIQTNNEINYLHWGDEGERRKMDHWCSGPVLMPARVVIVSRATTVGRNEENMPKHFQGHGQSVGIHNRVEEGAE